MSRRPRNPGVLAGTNLFYGLNERTRLYGDAAYAEGMESDVSSLDVAAYVDVAFKPIIRRDFQTEDWQRSRYFWTRVGYGAYLRHRESGRQESEDRGVVAVYGKAPLPAEVWLEARARADFRWIDGQYSTRYRARLEATREFSVLDHTVAPYINYEWFFDTRYDAWTRTLAQVGAEITIEQALPLRGISRRPEGRTANDESLIALGLLAKWYY